MSTLRDTDVKVVSSWENMITFSSIPDNEWRRIHICPN